jgi:hypothetical protein
MSVVRPAYPSTLVTRSNERTAASASGSLGSGAVTAAGLAVQQGLAAVVGVIIAHELGRTGETDGFFAAYGVYLVLAIAATAARVVLLPPLARARREGRLVAESLAFAFALGLVAVPLMVVAAMGSHSLARLLTGFDGGLAEATAESCLLWLIGAAVAQLYAGLAASALAALDDYRTAALGYASGSVLGLVFILARIGEDGVDAVVQGIAINGAVSLVVPTVALAYRARGRKMNTLLTRGDLGQPASRLGVVVAGVAFPLALQGAYLICLPFAADEGVGAVTSLGYAYIAGSAVITITSSALALVTSVPLTRSGLDPEHAARHVQSSSWIGFIAVAAATGVVALLGQTLAEFVLGGAYGDSVGQELGRLVVTLSPWMLVTVVIVASFPLAFVVGRGGALPVAALVVVSIQLPLAWLGDAMAGVYGLAGALAASTGIGLVLVLRILDVTRLALRGLVTAAGVVSGLAVVTFVPPGLVLEPGIAAVCGTALYVCALVVVRPAGLRSGWNYLRALS